jgi:hypothetical protein
VFYQLVCVQMACSEASSGQKVESNGDKLDAISDKVMGLWFVTCKLHVSIFRIGLSSTPTAQPQAHHWLTSSRLPAFCSSFLVFYLTYK